MGILRRHRDLFDLFIAHGECLALICDEMGKSILRKEPIDRAWLDRIFEIEREADRMEHAIIEYFRVARLIDHLSARPLEKADAIALTKSVDDMVNALKNAARRIYQYKPYGLRNFEPRFTEYYAIIQNTVDIVCLGLEEISAKKTRRALIERRRQLSELENQGDILHLDAVKELMDTRYASTQSKWEVKEIYEILEGVLDSAKRVGYVFLDICLNEQNG